MKKIIYTAAFTLLIASSAIAVQKPANKADLNSASIVHSGAHPNNANIQLATHHFEIYVQERSLTELLIE